MKLSEPSVFSGPEVMMILSFLVLHILVGDSQGITLSPVRPILPRLSLRVPLKGNRTAYLVGVFHGSPSSAIDVRTTMKHVRPSSVVVELCRNRYRRLSAITNTSGEENMTPRASWWGIASDAAGGGLLEVAAAGALGFVSLINPPGYQVGIEFLAAFDEARNLECDIILGDQDQRTTLRKLVRLSPKFGARTAQMPSNSPRRNAAVVLKSAVLGDGTSKRLCLPAFAVSPHRGQRAWQAAGFTFLVATITICVAWSVKTVEFDATLGPRLGQLMVGTTTEHSAVSVLSALAGTSVIARMINSVLADRDLVLARAIEKAAMSAPRGGCVVAVLGVLHVNGVANELEAPH